MSFLNKYLTTGISEFKEQSAIVSESYGGNRLRWIFSMAWCMLRYGARPIDYVRFEFHKKSARERNRYLTIFRYFYCVKHFGAGSVGVNGKVSEYQTYKEFIRRDWMVVTKNTLPGSIKSFVEAHNVVFAKPDNGDQGRGVLKIDDVNSDSYKLLLEKKDSSTFILEDIVRNCSELYILNPSSLNTVRATTLIGKDGTIHIISIILRVGIEGSHVDNWGAGGIGYNFDLDTGVCNMYGRDKKNRLYVYHPFSNVQMIGFKLPRFKELKDYIISLAKVFPTARYVGWDIAITPDGFDLIEMNCPAGHDMFQSFDNPIYDLMKQNW